MIAMKSKTCEEYVLNELEMTRKELELTNKRIVELEAPKEEAQEDMECIYLSDKPNYYYKAYTASVYKWNDILEDNGKTPKLVEEALKDNTKFRELCSLESKDNYYESIGIVKCRVYNYLLKTRTGDNIIIVDDYSTMLVPVNRENGDYFLSEEDAKKRLDSVMYDNIKYYLEDYKDKFEGDNNEQSRNNIV